MGSRQIQHRLARKAPWLLAMLAVGVAAPRVVGRAMGFEAEGWSVFAALVGIVGATVISGALWLYPPLRRAVEPPRFALGLLPPLVAGAAVIALVQPNENDLGALICCSPCILAGVFVPAVTLATTWARGGRLDGCGPERVVFAAGTIWFLGVWLTTIGSELGFEPGDCGLGPLRVGAQLPCEAEPVRIVRFAAAVFAATAAGISIALRWRRRSKVALLPLAGLAIWFAAQAVVDALAFEAARTLCDVPAARGSGVETLAHVTSLVEIGGLTLALVAWSAAGVLAFASPRRNGALRVQWRAMWPLLPALVLASAPPNFLDASGQWHALAFPRVPALSFLLAGIATLVVLGLVIVRELRRADRRCAGAIEAEANPSARVVPGWVHWRLATMRRPRELSPYRETLDGPEVAFASRATLRRMLARLARAGAWSACKKALTWAGLALALAWLWWLVFVAAV